MSFPFTKRIDGLNVALRLTPGAKKDAIYGTAKDENGKLYLKASVTAPPEGGRANKELVKLLARIWRLPKSSLSVIVGKTARRKVIHITGDPDALMDFFKDWIKKEKKNVASKDY